MAMARRSNLSTMSFLVQRGYPLGPYSMHKAVELEGYVLLGHAGRLSRAGMLAAAPGGRRRGGDPGALSRLYAAMWARAVQMRPGSAARAEAAGDSGRLAAKARRPTACAARAAAATADAA